MSLDERRKYTIGLLVLGVIIILAGLLSYLLAEDDDLFLGTTLMIGGAFLIVMAALRHWWLDRRVVDHERAKKDQAHAMAWSWQLTVLLLLVLFWKDLLDPLEMRIKDLTFGIMVVMLLSVQVFQLYFRRKED